ncbi:hypothetical protein PPERSA_11991 [Pseudocohnilembus persalinus]|uniref:Uncharacterized protein n=1 Tax=Pseudocohnilembus persalinus TaxID=266149 RepID=A0A0V0QKB0_PSEPJ|nr:hypothetical protein PPERSA_11991 [Pseudocohnilembus persalinus]|eukprot:KRX02651.1 hypothetical protein PPERSA_11991 [Pseudocohnilembus persalinus]
MIYIFEIKILKNTDEQNKQRCEPNIDLYFKNISSAIEKQQENHRINLINEQLVEEIKKMNQKTYDLLQQSYIPYNNDQQKIAEIMKALEQQQYYQIRQKSCQELILDQIKNLIIIQKIL